MPNCSICRNSLLEASGLGLALAEGSQILKSKNRYIQSRTAVTSLSLFLSSVSGLFRRLINYVSALFVSSTFLSSPRALSLTSTCAPRCGHVFHANCLQSWNQLSGSMETTCPFCRKTFMKSHVIQIFLDGQRDEKSDHFRRNPSTEIEMEKDIFDFGRRQLSSIPAASDCPINSEIYKAKKMPDRNFGSVRHQEVEDDLIWGSDSDLDSESDFYLNIDLTALESDCKFDSESDADSDYSHGLDYDYSVQLESIFNSEFDSDEEMLCQYQGQDEQNQTETGSDSDDR